MYITTAGVGRVLPGVRLDIRDVRPGDRILLSGRIGDHGITILLARGDLDLEADLASDSRPVLPMVEAMVAAAGSGIRWMRDPTRGGVATALNELARDCRLAVHLFEDRVPVRDAVRGACELLGLDPLHIANEGQFLAVVAAGTGRRGAQGAARDPRRRGCPRDRRNPRSASVRGAGDDTLRRHPHRGHAGRRSAAADLLRD